MLHLLSSIKVEQLATLTVAVAVLVTAIAMFAWLLTRVVGHRHLGLRHSIWVLALIFVSLSPVFVGVGQKFELPMASNVRFVAVNTLERLSMVRLLPSRRERLPTETGNDVGVNRPTSTPEGSLLGGNADAASMATFADAPRIPITTPQGKMLPAEKAVAGTAATASPGGETIGRSKTFRRTLSVLGLVWIGGSLIGVVRLCFGWLQLFRYRYSSELAGEAIQAELWKDVCANLDLRRPPQLRILADMIGPFTVGVVRPVVFIPRSLLNCEQSLRSVLLHECSHIACRHQWIGLLQRIVRIFAWWHPAIHFVNTRLNNVMELVCDNYVVQSVDRVSYAELLLSLTQEFRRVPRVAPLCMVYRPSALEKRISQILNYPPALASVSRFGVAAVTFAFALMLLLGTIFASPDTKPATGQKTLTFADEPPSNPRPRAEDDVQLPETIPADVISYVYYQGDTDNRPARADDTRWFVDWVAAEWGIDDDSISRRLGLTLMQLFNLADERQRICLCWERDGGLRKLLAIVASDGDSTKAMFDHLANLGFGVAGPADNGTYLRCEKTNSDVTLFAAYRPGMYLFSDSEDVLQRSLRLIDTDLDMKLVDQADHKAIANATRIDSRGAQVTWFQHLGEQHRQAHRSRSGRRVGDSKTNKSVANSLSLALDSVLQENLLTHIEAVGGTIGKPSGGEQQTVHHTMLYARPQGNGKLARLFHELPEQVRVDVPTWLPNNIQSYACFSVTPNSLLGVAHLLADEAAGEPGFFDDLLASLREDPEGPEINLTKDVLPHLGNGLHLAQTVDDRGETHAIMSLSITDEAAIGRVVEKIVRNDPSAQKHELPKTTLFTFNHNDVGVESDIGAMCIRDGQLILSTNEKQLRSILADPKRQAGRLIDSDLFRKLSTDLRAHRPQAHIELYVRGGNSLVPPFSLDPSSPPRRSFGERLSETIVGSTGAGPSALSVRSHPDGLSLHGVELRTDGSEFGTAPSSAHPLAQHNQISEIAGRKCILTAIGNSPAIGQMVQSRKLNNNMVLVDFRDDVSVLDARNELSNLIVEASTAYWELYFCYQNLAAAKTARDAALETWKQQAQGAAEAKCREQYFFFRARIEEGMRDLSKASNRLSFLLGLSAGELLRPTDSPTDPKPLSRYPAGYSEFDASLEKSLKSSPSFHQQLVKTSEVLARLSRQRDPTAKATVPTDDLLAFVDTVTAETKRLESMRSETAAQLTSAIADYESARMIALTNFNRLDAAKGEVKAMTIAYKDGTVTLDRLLDTQRRHADATVAYYQSAVNCILAELQYERLTGDLVGKYVVEVVSAE